MEDSAILGDALALCLSKRKELVHKLNKSIVDEEHAISARERFDVVKAAVEQVTEHPLNIKSRLREDVKCRTFIAYIMHRDGYSLYMIGKTMGKDHSTVAHMIKTLKDMLSIPSMYKTEVSQFKEVEKLV